MFANRTKAEIVSEIHVVRNESAAQNFLKLLDVLTAEARERNDTARPEDVLKNQGEIEAYKALRDYITRGLPALQNTP